MFSAFNTHTKEGEKEWYKAAETETEHAERVWKRDLIKIYNKRPITNRIKTDFYHYCKTQARKIINNVFKNSNKIPDSAAVVRSSIRKGWWLKQGIINNNNAKTVAKHTREPILLLFKSIRRMPKRSRLYNVIQWLVDMPQYPQLKDEYTQSQ